MQLQDKTVVEGGKSILFLGAGYSSEALNTLDQPIRDVSGLIEQLLSEIGEKETDGYDLESAADEFLDFYSGRGEKLLSDLLHKNFTSKTYTPEQRIIACQPWFRVYTSNYDNIVENIFTEEGKPFTVSEVSDPVSPPTNKATQIVHIYGNINRASADEFRRNFLLTESQRDNSPFLKSPWFRRFHDDILTAPALFFVGFSLTDIDLRRLLGSFSKEILQKVHFITWDGEKKPVITRMKKFGTPHLIGLSGLAEHLEEKRAGAPKFNYFSLPMALDEIDFRIQSSATVSSGDIERLMITGEVDTTKISQSDLNNAPGTYLIPRSKITLQRITKTASSTRPIVVHGDIGNGKSIFSYIVGYHYRQQNMRVFRVRREPEDIGEVISFLQSIDEGALVIFDDLMKFSSLPEAIINIGRTDIIVLGTVRSNLIDTARETVVRKFAGRSFVEADLNNVVRSEARDWVRYLDENGLLGERSSLTENEKHDFVEKRCRGQMRDVVLELYTSGALHQKVEELLNNIQELDAGSRNVIGFSALLTVSDFQNLARFSDIAELVDFNQSLEEFRASLNKKGLSALVRLDQGDVVIRSPALAQFILRRIFGLSSTLDIARKAVHYINDYWYDEHEFELLAKSLLKFSSYNFLVSSKRDGTEMEGFYNACRTLRFAQVDPLFWVQRSICNMKRNEFDIAERFVDTAYGLASRIHKFDTYQIDNHFARVLLTNSLENGVSDDGALELKASSLLQNVLSRKSGDLYHPLSVMRIFAEIVEKYSASFSITQRGALKKALSVSLVSINKSKSTQRFRNLPALKRRLQSASMQL